MGWLETYPHSIWANVGLDENEEIIYWKTVNYKKDGIGCVDKGVLKFIKMEHKEFICNNPEEHNLAFEKQSEDFYKQWKISKDFFGFRPYGENEDI